MIALFRICSLAFILLSLGTAYSQDYVFPVGDPLAKPTPNVRPNGFVLTQDFKVNGHTGVDLSNGQEGDPVAAVANGVIRDKCETTSATSSSKDVCFKWGNRIIIEHAGGFYSTYGHMKHGSLTTKPVGSTVYMGEKIGEVNCTGNTSGTSLCSNGGRGSHLHFEIKTEATAGCGYIPRLASCPNETLELFDNYYADPLRFIENRLPREKSIRLEGRVIFPVPAGVDRNFPNGANAGDEFVADVTYLVDLPDGSSRDRNQGIYGKQSAAISSVPLVTKLRITVQGGQRYEFPESYLESVNSNYAAVSNNAKYVSGPDKDIFSIVVNETANQPQFGIQMIDDDARALSSDSFPTNFGGFLDSDRSQMWYGIPNGDGTSSFFLTANVTEAN